MFGEAPDLHIPDGLQALTILWAFTVLQLLHHPVARLERRHCRSSTGEPPVRTQTSRRSGKRTFDQGE